MRALELNTPDLFALLGETAASSQVKKLIATLAGAASVLSPVPEVKSYRDCVYFNYFDFGISIQFMPVEGYDLSPGLQLESLTLGKLIVETMDIYNVPAAAADNTRAKSKTSHYKPYPFGAVMLAVADAEKSVAISAATMGKDIVGALGEPDRKGGGTGPSSGSIGIWCEWSRLGVMVEFGGDEARGPQAWEKGKDAVWSSLTLFAPKSK